MGELDQIELDAYYLVAFLKVQQELRPGSPGAFESKLGATLSELGIDAEAFARYLSDHREDLLRTCREVGI